SLFGAKVERSQEVDGCGAAAEMVAVVGALRVGNLPCVIEDRPAIHLDLDRSANPANETNELVVLVLLSVRRRMNRHEVDDLAHTVRRQEPGQQDVRVGQIHLPVSSLFRSDADAEMAAFPVVQNRREETRGVEVRETKPVDRSVDADEGSRVKIADDSVMFDREIAHEKTTSGMDSSPLGKSERSFEIAASRNSSIQR